MISDLKYLTHLWIHWKEGNSSMVHRQIFPLLVTRTVLMAHSQKTLHKYHQEFATYISIKSLIFKVTIPSFRHLFVIQVAGNSFTSCYNPQIFKYHLKSFRKSTQHVINRVMWKFRRLRNSNHQIHWPATSIYFPWYGESKKDIDSVVIEMNQLIGNWPKHISKQKSFFD